MKQDCLHNVVFPEEYPGTTYLYLYLPIKKKYIELIDAGIKKEEYREFNSYWKRRIGNLNNKYYDLLTQGRKVIRIARFHNYNGLYNDFIIQFIDVATGKPQWGAIPGKFYIRITLGKRIVLHPGKL